MRYSFFFSVIVALSVTLPTTAQQAPGQKENISASLPGNQMARVIATLPEITTFQASPSDRFLVDLASVRRGHPYRGRRA